MSSHEFLFDGAMVTSSLETTGDTFKVTVSGQQLHLRPLGGDLFALTANGVRSVVAVVKHQGVYYIEIDSVQLEVRDAADIAYGQAADHHVGDRDKVYAPMPGKIVKILVGLGDAVELKQPLVIVEAMKMENQVNAAAKGTVRAINFSAGDQVDTESPIIELELAQ
ncbi:MAG TPA: biotin/lipoyl-containing protein [Candidatus Deferrimicrobium sp.]|nr:biotin/lipoyl-containing protein [Candidatus Deferrimicrobium sp.]